MDYYDYATDCLEGVLCTVLVLGFVPVDWATDQHIEGNVLWTDGFVYDPGCVRIFGGVWFMSWAVLGLFLSREPLT